MSLVQSAIREMGRYVRWIAKPVSQLAGNPAGEIQVLSLSLIGNREDDGEEGLKKASSQLGVMKSSDGR